MVQGSLFTELLAQWKRDALEQEVRAARELDLIQAEQRDAHGLRAVVAAGLVRLAAHVDAAAVRSTAALGR